MDSRNAKTSGSNNTFACSQPDNKTTGLNGFQSPRQFITIGQTIPWGCHPTRLYSDIALDSFQPNQYPRPTRALKSGSTPFIRSAPKQQWPSTTRQKCLPPQKTCSN